MKFCKIPSLLISLALITACQNSVDNDVKEYKYQDFEFYGANKALLDDNINIFAQDSYNKCYRDFKLSQNELFFDSNKQLRDKLDNHINNDNKRCILLLSESEFIEHLQNIYDFDIKLIISKIEKQSFIDAKKLASLVKYTKVHIQKDDLFVKNLIKRKNDKDLNVETILLRKRNELIKDVIYLETSKDLYLNLITKYNNLKDHEALKVVYQKDELKVIADKFNKNLEDINHNIVELEQSLYKFAKQYSFLDAIALYNKSLKDNLEKK